jgi:dienelactone hydrolase
VTAVATRSRGPLGALRGAELACCLAAAGVDRVLRDAGAALLAASSWRLALAGSSATWPASPEPHRRPGRPRVCRREAPAAARFDGGACEDLSFESAYAPQRAGRGPNRWVRVRYWRHRPGEPRATIIALHGFGAEAPWLNQELLSTRWLFARGHDVALLTLPFHGARGGAGDLYSGQRFLDGGPAAINAACAQAVSDVRALLRYLAEERGARVVGVLGLSLGGYLAALLAGLEPRLAFCVPVVPVVSIPDLALEWGVVGAALRLAIRAGRVDRARLHAAFASSAPLGYVPRVPRDRLLIIAGAGDRLAPPEQALALWAHWRRPRLVWFPGGHVLQFGRRRVREQLDAFLCRVATVGGAGRGRRRAARRAAAARGLA